MRKTSRFISKQFIAACVFSWLSATAICAATNLAGTANSVNRDNKTDRLAITQRAPHNSAPAKNTVSSKHTPVGCEAAFSPFVNPGRANLLNYCVT